LRDLISKLLTRDPNARLGASIFGENGYDLLKRHPFFADFSFEGIFQSNAPQYLVPKQNNESEEDIKSFKDSWENSTSIQFSSNNSFFNLDDIKAPLSVFGPSRQRSMNIDTDFIVEKNQRAGTPEPFSPQNRAITYVKSTKALFSGIVKLTLFMFFSQEMTMVLYSNKQIILFQKGEAKVLHFKCTDSPVIYAK
jgi:hypothetical protein